MNQRFHLLPPVWRGLALVLTAALPGAPIEGQDSAATMVGVQDLAWGAHGRSLFFSAMRVRRDYSDYRPDKWAVYRYDLERGRVTMVIPAAFSVAASPTEPRVIVGKLVAGNRDLYLYTHDGAEVARLTTDPAEDFAAAWSPDGRTIAFNSKRGGHSELFLAGSDGSNQRRLLDAGSDRALSPVWSTDGRRLVYYRETGDGKDQIHVVMADGTGDRNLTQDQFNNVYPGWTPDGRVVYGQGLRGQRTSVLTVGADGADRSPLLGLKGFFTRFSPDGTRIATLEEHPEAEGVRVVITDTTGRVVATVPLQSVGAR